MLRIDQIDVAHVATEAERQEVLGVLRSTYLDEKGWATDVDDFFSEEDRDNPDIDWLVARVDGEAAGVLRVHYDPPIGTYIEYGLEFLDPSLNVEEFLKKNRVAEIGRFAVTPEFRNKVVLPAALMKGATIATIKRNYTHFVTDVLEDDPHSPYGFHTRVLGFQVVATHKTGELLSESRRLTLLLDLKDCYRRLRQRNSWFSRYMFEGWQEDMHQQMAA